MTAATVQAEFLKQRANLTTFTTYMIF